jgi:hypothetical protein
MAARLEVASDTFEVIKLSINNNMDLAIFVGHRLRTGHQVDNRQSRVAQSHAAMRRNPLMLFVGAAMNQ